MLNEFNSYFPKLICTPHDRHQLPLQAPNTTASFLVLFPPPGHGPFPQPRTFSSPPHQLSAQLAPPHPPGLSLGVSPRETPGHPAHAALSLQGHGDLFPGWPSAPPQTPKTAMLPDVLPTHMASSVAPGTRLLPAQKLPNTSVSKGQSRIPAQPCLTPGLLSPCRTLKPEQHAASAPTAGQC